ncbi:MAG TPA: ABC transporter substrate-binding protein [Acidimicrobiia bacterium]|nr:ABC transporter substrate-binding protein [Acidimicrobiia bacterium]
MRRIMTVLTLLALAACGTTGGVTDAAGASNTTLVEGATTTGEAPPEVSSDFPVTIAAANGEVTVGARPGRVVSLAPTATEMLFAIGAGDQVIAVDELSNYPEEAPTTDLSGFEPNVEAVAALDPDLVVVSDDFNDIVSALAAIEVPVIHHPAAVTLEDSYTQIEQLGAVTGNTGGSASLVVSMQSEIDRLVTSMPELDEPLSYYHELDGSLFSVTSETFIGEIYSLVGLENIADDADGAETLYPQLSAEHIIDADPDLIFLADTKCCGESTETVAARPGWGELTAVAEGSVVPLDDDIASRWGPRVVDLLETVVAAVHRMKSGGS